jgi:acetylornithine deacetylase/succinyl-diaminopimelate desuccinylase-like protein
VVPAEAVLWGEARSDEGPWLDGFADSVAAATAEVAGRRRLGSDLRWVSREPPVRTSGWLRGLEEEAAGRLGLDTLVVASGAGHDASQMAGLGPVGMIFVPSAGGRSHCPEEWTDAGQVAAGAAVLAETLRLADQGNPSGTGRDG